MTLWRANHRCAGLVKGETILKDLREFGGESALGFLSRFLPPRDDRFGCVVPVLHPLAPRLGGRTRLAAVRPWWAAPGLPEGFYPRAGAVETPDNRLHFVRCGSLHERESFGLLRLVIPDDLNRIRDKVFGGEPLFNVVGGDPNRVNCPERR